MLFRGEGTGSGYDEANVTFGDLVRGRLRSPKRTGYAGMQECEFRGRRTCPILRLDGVWTSPNRTPIFAIIGHWYTPDFEEREEVLEFVETHGSHTGEILAEAVMKILEELKIKYKLFSITGDNAGNNGTLFQSVYTSLKR